MFYDVVNIYIMSITFVDIHSDDDLLKDQPSVSAFPESSVSQYLPLLDKGQYTLKMQSKHKSIEK